MSLLRQFKTFFFFFCETFLRTLKAPKTLKAQKAQKSTKLYKGTRVKAQKCK